MGVLDTRSEERFDRLVRLASVSLGTPIALVSLIDEHRQWFKARVGLAATETPREMAFCAHAIHAPGETMVVNDATRDPRFAENPLVVDDPNIRFYAGRVVTDPDGAPLGTLCVIDHQPRDFRDQDDRVLTDLAHLVEQELARGELDELVSALDRSERSKAAMLDALAEGLVVQNSSGQIVEWNQAATELLGLSADQLAGRSSVDPRWRAVRVDGSPWPGDTHPAMESLRTGEPVREQTMGVHRPDSSLIWLDVNSRPIRDGRGDVTSVLTLFADVAASFDNERASATMALRLRQAIESSGIGTAILDESGSALFVNSAFTEILGIAHADALRRPTSVWIHPDDPEFGQADLDELLSVNAARATVEVRIPDRDGERRWARAHLTRLSDDATDDRFVLQLEDVTERRVLQDALRHSEELATAALDSLEQGVVLFDDTGAIHRLNPAAERILGFTASELTEQFRSGRWESYDERGDLMPREQRPLRRAMDTRRPVRGEILGWRHKAGHLVLLRLSCNPIPNDDGPQRFVVGFADVTDQHRAERLIDATFAMAPVGLAIVDDDGTVVRWNNTFAAHAGGSEPDPERPTLEALVNAADEADRTPDASEAMGAELYVATGDGAGSWLETRCAPIDDPERSMHILATFDITAHKDLEIDLQRFRHLVRNANDIITVVDETGRTIYASPSNERILGYPNGWQTPGGVLDLIHPDDLAIASNAFTALLNGDDGSDHPVTLRARTHDGGWKFIETIGINLLHEPSVRGIVLTSRDVTERQQLSDELAHRATHDPLTDLPNRSEAEERIGLALARARRDRTVASVCYLDLDNFKAINDTRGHGAGDDVLVEVARRLTRLARASDLPARIGGDEFIVVLESIDGPDRALDAAHRLLRGLTTRPIRSGDIDVGLSIGVAVSRPDDSIDSLLSRADAALYAAKSDSSKVVL
ncbi:MAG: PAS domain S-box protein, partial [Actinomycetota bacterium]